MMLYLYIFIFYICGLCNIVCKSVYRMNRNGHRSRQTICGLTSILVTFRNQIEQNVEDNFSFAL